MNKPNNFPGGSKTRVNRAGANVRLGNETFEDLIAIEEWRAAHKAVLNTFQASLRNRTRDTSIVVAQRHKRRNTIFNKLKRLPKMELARMDDVAGCRLIFESIEELSIFRKKFHKARFKHRRRNEIDKYDYIKHPKSTGYRGIHDVYSYDVNSIAGKRFKGLQVEIQYRTLIQHAWATAVEVIGFVTESQPKFQQGDHRYEHGMALASEIIARVHEDSVGAFPSKSPADLISEFNAIDKELNLLRTLKGINAVDSQHSKNRNVILIFSPEGDLSVQTYRTETEALKVLFKLEKEQPTMDIVLVKADTNEDIRMSFKNYFSDAKDFVRLVREGKKTLFSN